MYRAGKRFSCVTIVLSCLFLTVSFAYLPAAQGADRESAFVCADYREIPGVTQEEINQIENLKTKWETLVYGMCPSTETFYDEEGGIGGYTALFCDWLTSLFGIKFEPVIVQWDDLHAKMADGGINFTGELTSNPERLKTYFMTDAIAERTIKTFRLPDADRLTDIAKDREPRFAFLFGTNTLDLVEPVAEFSFETSYVNNYEEAVAKLSAGDIDAFLIDGPAEEAFSAYGNIEAEDFFPLIYTPVSLSTLNSEFEPIISVLQKYLGAGALFQLIDLYNQGERSYYRHKLMTKLTEEEKDYILQHVAEGIPVTLAAETETYPGSFYNEQEGEWQGITHDVMAGITELTGLTFQPVNAPDADWYELLDMLERGGAAMTTELIYSRERAGRFLWADKPYSEDRYALLSTVEHEDININEVLYSKVGLIYKTAYTDVFKDWFPEHPNTVEYKGFDEAFIALEAGEIDVLLAPKNLLLRATNYMENPGFKANLVFDRTYGSSFGFNKDEAVLCSIVSKAQSLINTASITDRWTYKVFDYRAKLNRARIPLLVGLSVLLCVALLLAIVLVMRNRKANAVLEQTVRERTNELVVQTETANVASRAKGEFLARMSHEIRTPLNSVVGMAHITRQNAGDKNKTLRSTDEILKASNHLMGLINDVLDLSKIESGKFEIMNETFELRAAMQEVGSLISPRCVENRIGFETNLGELNDVTVLGDKLRLKQVLINLMGNSVKFTGRGGNIWFTVDVVDEDENNIVLRFSVKDNGIGVPPDRLNSLFTAFEQADSTISSKFGGTGLGLAISQNLVQMMGGEIVAESVWGKGSLFSFTIAFTKTDETKDTVQDGDEHNHMDLSGKRILLAEDIAVNRLILRELLRETNVEIEEAPDGKAAVEMFKSSEEGYYDLVFMDIQMPEMDGYEATSEMRNIKRGDAGSIPIIAMTANAYREDIERALSAGMNGHLPKPVDIDALMRLLYELLALKKDET